jgi:hypothetical protein
MRAPKSLLVASIAAGSLLIPATAAQAVAPSQAVGIGSVHETAVVAGHQIRRSPWQDGYRDGRNDAASNALEVAKAYCAGKTLAPNRRSNQRHNADKQYAAGYDAGWKAGWKPAYDRSVHALCPGHRPHK